MRDKPVRSFAKGLSWRIFATMDTFTLAWLILGDVALAVPIALTEVATKVFLYFIHERLWNRFQWGRKENGPTHLRSVMKGVSWRFFGSIDTVLISLFYSGHLLGAFKIGFSEVLTKIALFYLHERIWALVRWGRVRDEVLA